MSSIRDLEGAFSLISCIDNDDVIDSIICEAIEHDLDINELDYLDYDECLLECYY